MTIATVPAAAQTPPPGSGQIKINISPAGQVVLKKYLGVRDPVIVPMVEQLRVISVQMAALADTPKLDLVRLRDLMRRQEGIQSAIQRRGNDRTLAMLGELSEADRIRFLRSLKAARTGSGSPSGK